MASECILQRLDSPRIRIHLADGVLTHLGRGDITGIYDEECSRRQLTIIANFTERNITLWRVGRSPSNLNGVAMMGGHVAYTAVHNDILEIVPQQDQFLVIFVEHEAPVVPPLVLVSSSEEDEDEEEEEEDSEDELPISVRIE